MNTRVRLNGRPADVCASTVADLLAELGHAAHTEGIAVAVNRELVPRARWAETRLREHDEIEIIGAVQGG